MQTTPFPTAELLRVLPTLQTITDRRTTLNVLQHLRVESHAEGTTLSAHNLDIWAETTLPSAISPQPLLTAINAKDVHFCVENPTQDTLQITAFSKKELVLSSKNTVHYLQTLPVDELPSLPQTPEHCAFEIQTWELLQLLTKVRPLTSTDETRYILCGVRFQTHEGHLRVVATDSRRLVAIDLPNISIRPEANFKQAILPNELLDLILVALTHEDPEKPTSFFFTETRCELQLPSKTRIGGKLIDGAFPNWKHIHTPEKDLKYSLRFTQEEANAIQTFLQPAESTSADIIVFPHDGRIHLANYSEANKTLHVLPNIGKASPHTPPSYFVASYLKDHLALFPHTEDILLQQSGNIHNPFQTSTENTTAYLMARIREIDQRVFDQILAAAHLLKPTTL
jgi:DNA polymerase III sliding clamp (beta) subunit (PCNA family)